MSGTGNPLDRNAQQYMKVMQALDEDDEAEAVRIAKFNLTDLGLSRYWQVKNCIIIVFAEEDWIEAEKFRLAAEEVHAAASALTPIDDDLVQEHLADLRDDLNEVAQSQREDDPRPPDQRQASQSSPAAEQEVEQDNMDSSDVEDASDVEDEEEETEEDEREDAFSILRRSIEVRRRLAWNRDEATRINLGIVEPLTPDVAAHSMDFGWNSVPLKKRRRMQETVLSQKSTPAIAGLPEFEIDSSIPVDNKRESLSPQAIFGGSTPVQLPILASDDFSAVSSTPIPKNGDIDEPRTSTQTKRDSAFTLGDETRTSTQTKRDSAFTLGEANDVGKPKEEAPFDLPVGTPQVDTKAHPEAEAHPEPAHSEPTPPSAKAKPAPLSLDWMKKKAKAFVPGSLSPRSTVAVTSPTEVTPAQPSSPADQFNTMLDIDGNRNPHLLKNNQLAMRSRSVKGKDSKSIRGKKPARNQITESFYTKPE